MSTSTCWYCFHSFNNNVNVLTCNECNATWCSKECQQQQQQHHSTICSPDVKLTTNELLTRNHLQQITTPLGISIMTTQKIPFANHIIFQERPILIASRMLHKNPIELIRLSVQFSCLSERIRNDLCLLVGGTTGLFELMHYNNLPFVTEHGDILGGLYRVISRFNHSCRPNSRYVYRSDLKIEQIISLTSIEPGQEIFVSYFDPLRERHLRQDLSKRMGFECQCEVCVTNDPSEDEWRGLARRLGEEISSLLSKKADDRDEGHKISLDTLIKQRMQLLAKHNFIDSRGYVGKL
jgi:hypothetical protein